ncbi:MAG: hypothetical protein KF894_09380 [Labilithrix sp.]|nr:hypothetical protein [Labilithrix sp.]
MARAVLAPVEPGGRGSASSGAAPRPAGALARTLARGLAASAGWWLAVLAGSTLGGAFGWFVSPLAGRLVGGVVAGLVGGALEARANGSLRGRRLGFTGASAVVTTLFALTLLDVEVLPWLVGGVFGGALGAAQGLAAGLGRRGVSLRASTSAAAWSLGFIVLQASGPASKLGLLAPALAGLLLHLASRRRVGAATPALA